MREGKRIYPLPVYARVLCRIIPYDISWLAPGVVSVA